MKQQTKAFLTDHLAQLVMEAVPVPIHQPSVAFILPDVRTLETPSAIVHQDQVTVNKRCIDLSSHPMPFPVVNQLPLHYPIQTGKEAVTFKSPRVKTFQWLMASVVKSLNLGLERPISYQQLNRVSQALFSWKPIPLQQIPLAERQWLGEQCLSRVQCAMYDIQAVFYPIHVNRFYKLLRHPSGKLLGISAKDDTSPAVASVPHVVVWLTANGKPRMESIPLEGRLW